MKIEGLKQLQEQITKLESGLSVQNKKEMLKQGAEVLLKGQKQYAPTAKKGSKNSRSHLSIKSKSRGGNEVKSEIGINKDNWEYTRGLYFHYWGFKSHPPDNWLDRAFNATEKDATDAIINKFKQLIDEGVI